VLLFEIAGRLTLAKKGFVGTAGCTGTGLERGLATLTLGVLLIVVGNGSGPPIVTIGPLLSA
jgi:hypothetical protein